VGSWTAVAGELEPEPEPFRVFPCAHSFGGAGREERDGSWYAARASKIPAGAY